MERARIERCGGTVEQAMGGVYQPEPLTLPLTLTLPNPNPNPNPNPP